MQFSLLSLQCFFSDTVRNERLVWCFVNEFLASNELGVDLGPKNPSHFKPDYHPNAIQNTTSWTDYLSTQFYFQCRKQELNNTRKKNELTIEHLKITRLLRSVCWFCWNKYKNANTHWKHPNKIIKYSRKKRNAQALKA